MARATRSMKVNHTKDTLIVNEDERNKASGVATKQNIDHAKEAR
jgi:hypothetical protein